MFDTATVLRGLADKAGTSGSESSGISDAVEALFLARTDDVWRDPHGDVFARMGSGSPTILICAHMDEVGLAVSGIAENGMLRMARIAGVDPRVLPGLEVTVHGKKPLRGIIGAIPPHLSGNAKEPYRLEELTCDVGLSYEEACALVSVGDSITYAPGDPEELLSGSLTSKTLDDRALITVMLDTMDHLRGRTLPCTVVFCATCEEEVGCFGGGTAGHHVMPDMAVALDVGHAPTEGAPSYRTAPLDRVILYKGGNIHPGMFSMLSACAAEWRVPTATIVAMGATGTDGRRLQMSGLGVPTAVVEVPLKYMHTPVELISVDTLHACARLLTEWLSSISPDWEDKLCWND